VRYAKWRAAEISKAIREGRQPTPVSPGGEPAETTATTIESTSASVHVPTHAPPIPPPTTVTDVPDDAHVGHEQVESYSTSVPPLASTAFGELEGETTFDFEVPPGSAPVPINASDPQLGHDLLSGTPEMPLPPTLPHGSPTVDMESGRGRSTSIDAASLTSSPVAGAQRSTSPMHLVPPDSPPSTASYLTENLYPSAPPLPPPPPAPYVRVPVPVPPPPTLLEMAPPAELTPGLIAKTQKHCRFAISALDYEDAEQARKELRAALAILGG
jgi:vacuolar protein sorting-associated protein VTA1